MANFDTLKALIAGKIHDNTEQEITAADVRDSFDETIDAINGAKQDTISDLATIEAGAAAGTEAAYREYDSENPNGLGYLVLEKDKTFAEQVTEANTIYEIRYDYDISEDFTIPSGCTLLFNGGSINGAYELTFTDTVIQGDARILTTGLAGTIPGTVDLGWFGIKEGDNTYDNGPIINRAAAVFKYLYLPKGAYYFTTPIVLANMSYIKFVGGLYYIGTNTDTAAVYLSGRGTFAFDGRISGYYATAINYAGDGGTSVRGLEFACNTSKVYIWSIKNFNECLRVAGDGAGASYNNFYIGELANANRCLRIYQDNGGWANENHFNGGRLWEETAWKQAGRNYCAVHIGGPGTASDTYDKANGLSFKGMSTEGFQNGYTVFARNLQYSVFKEIRNENSSGAFIVYDGTCRYNTVDLGYASAASGTGTGGGYGMTLTTASSYPLRHTELAKNKIKTISLRDFHRTYASGSATGYWATEDMVWNIRNTTFTRSHISSTMTESGGQRTTGNHIPGVVLSCANVRGFYIRADMPARFVVWYVEKTDGTVISGGSAQQNYLAPLTQIGKMAYQDSAYGYRSGVDETESVIYIADTSVAKVAIGCYGTFNEFSVFTLGNTGSIEEDYFEPIAVSGATADRPQRAWPGQQFYDTTLDQLLLWDGAQWITGQVQSDWTQADNSAVDYIKNKPAIPPAPGTLDTDNTGAQTVNASEALSGTVKLHKVAKTGTYSDLIGTPTIPTVPTISTNIAADASSDTKTASPKAVYSFVRGAKDSMPVGGFLPDVVYELGELSGTVTFALAATVAGNINHYFWTFETGASAPTVNWPAGLTWADGSAPTPGASKHCEVSVLGGVALYMEV